MINPKTKIKNKQKPNMKTKTAKKAVKKTAKKKAQKKTKKIVTRKKKAVAKKKVTKTAPAEMQLVNKEVTKLKVWMMERRINQKELAKKTSLSTNTINRLVNNGHATKSVVKLVSYELGISVEQMMELLKFGEPVNS